MSFAAVPFAVASLALGVLSPFGIKSALHCTFIRMAVVSAMDTYPIGRVLFYDIQAGAFCFSLMSGVVSARAYMYLYLFTCNECCCMDGYM